MARDDGSLKNAGKKKGGFMGLPTYVWLGVIAAGLLLGIYLRSRGGNSNATVADNGSYPTSLTDGMAGQSIGGNTAADTSALDGSTISDLMNGIGTLTADVEANTEQLAGLTDVFGNIPSSGGSGASADGKTSSGSFADLVGAHQADVSKAAKAVKKAEHKKHHKKHHHKRGKVAA